MAFKALSSSSASPFSFPSFCPVKSQYPNTESMTSFKKSDEASCGFLSLSHSSNSPQRSKACRMLQRQKLRKQSRHQTTVLFALHSHSLPQTQKELAHLLCSYEFDLHHIQQKDRKCLLKSRFYNAYSLLQWLLQCQNRLHTQLVEQPALTRSTALLPTANQHATEVL